MEKSDREDLLQFKKQLQSLFSLEKWDHAHIEASFRLLTEITILKAHTRFNLQQALKIATQVLDTNAFNAIRGLNKFNITDPEEVMSEFARLAAQEMIAQFEIMKADIDTAILVRTHPDYEDSSLSYQPSIRADFLLEFLLKEINWHEAKRLEVALNKQLDNAGVGKYGMMLKVHLRDTDISRYRQMLENDSACDFIVRREGEFLIALQSSIQKGMSEKEAEKLNWSILTSDS